MNIGPGELILKQKSCTFFMKFSITFVSYHKNCEEDGEKRASLHVEAFDFLSFFKIIIN